MSWPGSGLEPLPMRGDTVSTGVGDTTQSLRAGPTSYNTGLVDDEGSNTSSSSYEDSNGGGAQDVGTRASKRRRIDDHPDDGDEDDNEDNDVPMENGIHDNSIVHGLPAPVPVAVTDPNDSRIPHFKPGLPDPDDKGENDCFFEDCLTRAGGNQYFV